MLNSGFIQHVQKAFIRFHYKVIFATGNPVFVETCLLKRHKLLTGTGNLIRHIDVKDVSDYRNPKVEALILEAIDFAIKDMDKATKSTAKTISKIKK